MSARKAAPKTIKAPSEVSQAASALGKLRWAKVSKEARSEAMSKLGLRSWEKRRAQQPPTG